MPAPLCFWPCFWAMRRGCTLWHQGAHPAKLPSGVCLPPCPRQPQDGSVGCCQQPFPAARLAQCTGRPGLALRWGECWWPLARATMQQPLRKCRHEEMLGMLTLPPPPPHPHHHPNACPGRGLQPCRAPAPPAQPLPLQVALTSGGDVSSPCSGGAELPEQCQHRLLLWETTSRRGRNLASLQTSTGATGISLQRLFFQVIYFQVWSIRATPHPKTFFLFHCHQDGEKLALKIQSKHPPLVSDSRGWALNPSQKSASRGRLQILHPADAAYPWVLLQAELGSKGSTRVHLGNGPIRGNMSIKPKYLEVLDGASQAEWRGDIGCRSPRMLPSCARGLLGWRPAQAAGGLGGITRGGC